MLKKYFILNGIMENPMKVHIQQNHIIAYRSKEDNELTPKEHKVIDDTGKLIYDYQSPVYSKTVSKIFIGNSPMNHMTKFSGGNDETWDGNSILVRESSDSLKYVYIGATIFSFYAKHVITVYVSPLGNSSVPYPYAISQTYNEYYLMLEKVMLDGNRLGILSLSAPYDIYYCLSNNYGDNCGIKCKSFSSFYNTIQSIHIGTQECFYHISNASGEFARRMKQEKKMRQLQKYSTVDIPVYKRLRTQKKNIGNQKHRNANGLKRHFRHHMKFSQNIRIQKVNWTYQIH